MLPPPLPHQIDVLRKVMERTADAASGTRPPLVVFDLDATLFDNRPRTLQILSEYAEEVRADYPEVADALLGLSIDDIRYLLSDTLRAASLHQTEVVRDVNAYWRDRFFSDEYVGYDTPTDGAAAYVRALHESGAVIVYLGGRDVTSMMLGTVASLRDHDFPLGLAGVELVLKPDANMSDEAFKRGALPTLDRVGDIIAFFDNEPANCNLARQLHSDAEIVLVDTTVVPGAPPPFPGISMISDFRMA